MKKKEVPKFLKASIHNLHKCYAALLRSYEPEAVHEFRVAYKKLRAHMRLLNTTLKGEAQLRTGKKLDHFYHLAGNLRNLQLHRTFISNLAHELLLSRPVHYLIHVEREIKGAEKEVDSFSKTIAANHFEHLVQNKFVTSYHADAVQGFINHYRMLLVQFIYLYRYKDDDLHSIRKILKDFLYNKPFLLLSPQTMLPHPFHHFTVMEQFAGMLGNFNDLCMALEILDADVIASISQEAERNVLLFMHSQLEQKKQKAIAEITTLLASVKNEMNLAAMKELSEVGMQ